MSKATSEIIYSFLKDLYCLKNFFDHFLALLMSEAEKIAIIKAIQI
jgi:hypothetical protein